MKQPEDQCLTGSIQNDGHGRAISMSLWNQTGD